MSNESMKQSIVFQSGGREIMRINSDGIHVNTDIEPDEVSQSVLKSMDEYIKNLVKVAVESEREACARVADDISAKYKWLDDVAEKVASQWCADAIRARSQA